MIRRALRTLALLATVALAPGFAPSRTFEPAITRVCATTDTQNSSGTVEVAADGLSFTPSPGAYYRITADVVHTAAATTTGLQGRLDPGNATTGGCYAVARGTSPTTQVQYTGSVGTAITTNDVLATSSASAGFTRWQYGCDLQATSAPTAITLKFYSEVAGSTVTVKAGMSCLHIERLGP